MWISVWILVLISQFGEAEPLGFRSSTACYLAARLHVHEQGIETECRPKWIYAKPGEDAMSMPPS